MLRLLVRADREGVELRPAAARVSRELARRPLDWSPRAEREIDTLYRELAVLAEAGAEEDFQVCLTRLQELEDAAAKRIHADYAARLPEEALERAIRTAEELLAENEGTASVDRPSTGPP